LITYVPALEKKKGGKTNKGTGLGVSKDGELASGAGNKRQRLLVIKTGGKKRISAGGPMGPKVRVGASIPYSGKEGLT